MVFPVVRTAQAQMSKIPLLHPSHHGVPLPVLPKPIPEASISLCLRCRSANLGHRRLAQGATAGPS